MGERMQARVAVLVWIILIHKAVEIQAKGRNTRIPITGARQKARPKQKVQRPDWPHGSESRNKERSDDHWGGGEDDWHNQTYEERLMERLFRSYNSDARGTWDNDNPIQVDIEFVLLRIHGLDERSMVFTTTGLIMTEWGDERLRWDPRDYGNLTDIILRADKVWRPELAVMNGADEMIPEFEKIRVLLHHTGRLHWEPGGIFRTTCDIDITFFPFDSQQCSLLIGAWSYHSKKMNITSLSDSISTHDFRLNGEWHVYKTTAVRNETILECCPGHAYAHVVFTLFLSRRHTFYIMNIILPCVMLSMLILIGFYLPPEAGEKVSLGISVLLAFTVFLLMVADIIPRTSLSVPLMVAYLTATMFLGAISVCLTVLVMNMHHRCPDRPVPRLLYSLILCYLCRLVCVKTRASNVRSVTRKVYVKSTQRTKKKTVTSTETNGNVEDMELVKLTVNAKAEVENITTKHAQGQGMDDERDEGRDYARDWQELAYVTDRCFFWVIFLMMSMAGVLILVYPFYTGKIMTS